MQQGSGKAEIVTQKKNGEMYWIDMNWAPVMNNGELLYLLINSVDITERKRIEEALQESEEKFSKAFSSSPNTVCIVTAKEGTFIDVNDSFLRFTGYSREEAIGHTPVELDLWVNKDDMKKIMKAMVFQSWSVSMKAAKRTKKMNSTAINKVAFPMLFPRLILQTL